MKKMLTNTFIILLIFYTLACVLIYFIQERLIFFPEKLTRDFKFQFDQPFQEINMKTEDQKLLNGLLFPSNNSKGLIFYLHGNAGSIHTWGAIAKNYTDLNYDFFMLDYRGYGKSEGSISSQDQLYQDVQLVYNEMKKKYSEDKIIVLGYSIGTGMATKLASVNNPRKLILQAPFYSLTDLVKRYYPILPSFILKYKFETNKYIKDCKMPIVIFHGNQDEVIYYKSSVRLKEIIKKTDTLIIIKGLGHNGMTDHPEYQQAIKNILSSNTLQEVDS